jgi:shikimate dehydrogenase
LAEHLADRFAASRLHPMPLDAKRLWEPLQAAHLIVNTTSVGMHPNEEAMPLEDLPSLGPEVWVYDIVYHPRRTRFLQRAEERGARTVEGTDMLVYQGALSFERWTGIFPPVEVMRTALIRFLEGT